MIRKFIIAALALSAVFGCVLFALSVNRKFGYSGAPVGLIFSRGCATLTIRDSTARHAGIWRSSKMRASRSAGQRSPRHRLWRLPAFQTTRSGIKIVTIPLWIPPIVFGAYPALFFFRGPVLRWRRRRRGLCEGCGYDIRVSKERCPECGNSIESNQC